MTVTEVDGRECVRGPHCANAWTGPDGTRHGAWGPRPLCETDRAVLVDAIAEMPELYAWLWMQLPPGATGGEHVTGGHAHPPLPLRSDVDELMREIYAVLASWEERVRLVARLTDRPTLGPQPDGRALTRITRTLATHVDVLLSLLPDPMARVMRPNEAADLPEGTPGRIGNDGQAHVLVDLDGPAAGVEILRLHRRARARAGHTRRTTALPGVTCPECGLLAIVRLSGSNPHCSSCRTELADTDLDAVS